MHLFPHFPAASSITGERRPVGCSSLLMSFFRQRYWWCCKVQALEECVQVEGVIIATESSEPFLTTDENTMAWHSPKKAEKSNQIQSTCNVFAVNWVTQNALLLAMSSHHTTLMGEEQKLMLCTVLFNTTPLCFEALCRPFLHLIHYFDHSALKYPVCFHIVYLCSWKVI